MKEGGWKRNNERKEGGRGLMREEGRKRTNEGRREEED